MARAALGEVEEARREFALAKETFDARGALLFLAETRRAERRMNARLPRRPPSGRYGLTRRENTVAELAATGLTNRESGARLHLSPKTVEACLSRVFNELGVSTRTALARRYARS